MSDVIPFRRPQIDRVAGRWKFRDGFSEIEFEVSVFGEVATVVVVDKSDGERPEVYGVQWDEDTLVLRFALHWSHGRFQQYRVAVGPDADRIEATITTTVQELWERL